METIPWTQFLIPATPSHHASETPIAGRLLGEVTVEELMQAAMEAPAVVETGTGGMSVTPTAYTPVVLLDDDAEED